MTIPDHIARIIERIEPADREALEQYLNHNTLGGIMALQQIREAIGDPHGKLMQDDLVERVRELVAHNDQLSESRKRWRGLAVNDGNFLIEVVEILNQSPAASLAEVRAQAVQEFAQELGVFDPEYDDQGYIEVPRYAIKKYIDQIRQEAKCKS